MIPINPITAPLNARLRRPANFRQLLVSRPDCVTDDLQAVGIQSSVAGGCCLFNLLRAASTHDGGGQCGLSKRPCNGDIGDAPAK
jgi:hypothetical protein